MRLREAAFALALLLSSVLVVYGVGFFSEGAAWIVAGVLAAGWTWAVLSE